MNADLAPRQAAPQWLRLFSGLQFGLILAIVAWQVLSGSDMAAASFLRLYAMLNLALVIALSFLSVFAQGNSVGSLAFLLAGTSFALLFWSELQVDSSIEDWSALAYWIASAAALTFAVRSRAFPAAVHALLAIAVFSQGAGAISDLVDDGLLSPHPTRLLSLINLLGFALSMAAYQAGIQYFVQSSQWPAELLGRRAGLFSFWQHALPKPVKHRLMVAWYDLVALLDRKGEVLFMNHGYAPKPGTKGRLSIPPDLERFRYPIQLYDLIARVVDWKDKDALEVSSGLGGGTLWIFRMCSPKSLTGLDIAASAVRKCVKRYGSLGIAFKTGDAQRMPFGDASFDIVVNVESSLNYSDLPAFLSEVDRVLRPGGYFLFADYRSRSKIERLRQSLDDMRFEPLMLEDVTEGIVRGLERDAARKRELIQLVTPRLLRNTVTRFAGVDHGNASEYAKFASGRKIYIAAVFRKPEIWF
jgi:ubiquinone/menaquinone biosynthesis C-methylase UbiE